MKKIIFLYIIFGSINTSYAQNYDEIITTKGESYVCRIDSITDTHIYFSMVVRQVWVNTYIELNMVNDYQINRVVENVVDLEQDTLIFDEKEKIKFYKTWVKLTNSAISYKGVLFKVDDSSITLSNSLVINDYIENNFETMNFQAHNIKMIMIRKKNNTLRGMWVGAVSGLGASILVGLIATKDIMGAPAGTIYLWPLTVVGAGVGAIIGSVTFKIPINGDMNRYNNYRRMLKRRSIK